LFGTAYVKSKDTALHPVRHPMQSKRHCQTSGPNENQTEQDRCGKNVDTRHDLDVASHARIIQVCKQEKKQW